MAAIEPNGDNGFIYSTPIDWDRTLFGLVDSLQTKGNLKY